MSKSKQATGGDVNPLPNNCSGKAPPDRRAPNTGSYKVSPNSEKRGKQGNG